LPSGDLIELELIRLASLILSSNTDFPYQKTNYHSIISMKH